MVTKIANTSTVNWDILVIVLFWFIWLIRINLSHSGVKHILHILPKHMKFMIFNILHFFNIKPHLTKCEYAIDKVKCYTSDITIFKLQMTQITII